MSTVDWVAVATVLVAGEAIGVHAPIPGHQMQRDVPSLDVAPPTEPFAGTKEQALDALDSLIREVIRRTPSDESFVLGLSGGRDSRHLLLAARDVGRPVSFLLTVQHWSPGPSWADVQGARALADALGLEFQVIPSAGDRYVAEWEKNRILGLRTLNHSWILPMADRIPGGATLLDGLNGGNLLGRDSLTRSWVESRGPQAPTAGEALDHVIRRLVRGPRKRIRPWLLSPRIDDGVWAEVEERLEERFLRYVEFPNPFQAWAYLEHTRCGIALAPYVLLNADKVLCPYFDPEVVSLGLSLPWEVSSQSTLQTEMLARLYPDVASVPYSHQFETDEVNWQQGLDVEAEAKSWKRISQFLPGHVSGEVVERAGGSGQGLHGNRRLVLMAQAVAAEEGDVGIRLSEL